MTVAELLARISSSELTRWMALTLVEGEEAKQRELDRNAAAGTQATLAMPRRR